MKFNEKLIELRKKEGLSQEELGYKLNVTRQTVSKWELGQTTPEMDKLVEMSRIFNISVDELINESETQTDSNPIIEDQPIVNESKKEKNVKTIIVVALIIVIVFIVFNLLAGISVFNMFNKTTDAQKNIFDKVFSIFDKGANYIDKTIDKTTEEYDETKKQIETIGNKILNENQKDNQEAKEIINKVGSKLETEMFNDNFERYSGTKKGNFVISLLDNIITSNKKEDRKVTIKYMETETQDEFEIKNIKRNIGTFDDYEVTFEYDTDGFINKAIIENF